MIEKIKQILALYNIDTIRFGEIQGSRIFERDIEFIDSECNVFVLTLHSKNKECLEIEK